MTEEQRTERIIDKLRKVMALTKSPVEGEAQAALATLKRLLTEYNLSVVDLEQRGAAAKPGVTEGGHDLGKAAFTWKLDLAETIADHYFCYAVVNRYAKTVSFIGRPDNVDSLKALYEWVIDQIRRIASEERVKWQKDNDQHVDPLRWQVNFGLGVVHRIGARLEELRQQAANDNKQTAMVLSHKAEISDYLEEKQGMRIDGRKTKREEQWEKEYHERQAMKQRLKETDIEAFYAAYPHERPLTPEQQVEQEKANEEWMRKEDRNRRRRTGGGGRSRRVDWRKEEQAASANQAGRSAANKVNLEPFLKEGSRPKGELGD